MSNSETSWTVAHQASLSITNSWSLLKRVSIESVMPSNHLVLCRPLFLPLSAFPSIRVFSSESVLHIRWQKYWSFSFSISPSNEYSGLISFSIDWIDLPVVKAMAFPVVMYRCESWTIKKAEHQKTDAFELWCWRKLFRVPWTARKSSQPILKEINPEYSLEELMLKLQYSGHLM